MRNLVRALLLLALPLMAADTTRLTVQVNSAINGKGIDRASVIVRYSKVGKKKASTSWSDMETKTNQEGSVVVPLVPRGRIEIQVIATNYQTFGNIYEISKPEEKIEITLNPPQPQYSEAEKTQTVPKTK